MLGLAEGKPLSSQKTIGKPDRLLAIDSLPEVILNACGATAISLMIFAWSDMLALSLVAMAAIGFGITASNVGTNIVLQSEAPEALRGRVVSLYTSIRFGFDALGGLFIGLLASHFSAPHAMTAAGVGLLFYCLWIARPRKRD